MKMGAGTESDHLWKGKEEHFWPTPPSPSPDIPTKVQENNLVLDM